MGEQARVEEHGQGAAYAVLAQHRIFAIEGAGLHNGGHPLRAFKMARISLIILTVLVISLISGLIVASPMVHAQSTVIVSETVGSGSQSGAPGYAPDVINVVVGVNNTISWTNNDLGHNHTVTSMEIPPGAKPFDSGKMAENATFAVTLTVPGVYRYGCSYHPWMTGVIDVELASNGSTTNSVGTTNASSSNTTTASTTASTTGGFPSVYLVVILVVVVVIVLIAATRLRSRPSRPSPVL